MRAAWSLLVLLGFASGLSVTAYLLAAFGPDPALDAEGLQSGGGSVEDDGGPPSADPPTANASMPAPDEGAESPAAAVVAT